MSATAWARRTYSGSAAEAELDTGITSSSLSITVDNGAGFPSTGPFLICIDREEPTEERIEVASRSTNTLTVTSTAQRGVDGTTAAFHSAGAKVEHVYGAIDADEANAASHHTVGKITTKGDLLAGTGANAMTRVAVGSDGLPLVADSGETGGVGFAALGPEGLAANAVETAKIDDDAVTSAKIEAAQRWEPGDIKISARSSATSGWLACDGSNVSRSTYADLFSAIGTTFGAGDGSTTFGLPGAEDAFLIGAGGTYALAATGGAATHTLTDDELPEHVHSVGLTTGNQSANHTHGAGTYTAAQDTHNHESTGTSGNYIIPVSSSTLEVPDQAGDNGNFPQPVTSSAMPNDSHTHSITGTSGSNSVNHTHSVSGNTGVGPGSADAFSILPPYLAVNVFIKT